MSQLDPFFRLALGQRVRWLLPTGEWEMVTVTCRQLIELPDKLLVQYIIKGEEGSVSAEAAWLEELQSNSYPPSK